jgi:predicted small lipoprotein YifL
MKYMYAILIVGVLFVGCGYKGPPIYVDDNTEIKK